MTDGLNVDNSFNNYEDSLNDYSINSPSQQQTNPVFDQVKHVVKENLTKNKEQIISNQNIRSRFISLKGSLNSKLKDIFHNNGKSSFDENEKELFETKELKKEEEKISNEEKSSNFESNLESLSVGKVAEESPKIEKENDLEKKIKKEELSKESFSKSQEKSKEVDSFIEENKTHENNNKDIENELDVGIQEGKYEVKENKVIDTKKNEVDNFFKTEVSPKDFLEKNDYLEKKAQKENKETSEESQKMENGKQSDKVKSDEEIEEELRLAEDLSGDSMSEIEQMEIQTEDKKEENSEEHEKEEVEAKEENKSLLPGIVEIDNLENKNEEVKEKEEKRKEKNKVLSSIKIPVDLITFIKKNISEILSHKNYSINNYNCVFYAEDVAVFSLNQFNDIMVSIFRSSVSAMEAEKIYQTRQKAKKFIRDNNLFLLQVSADKLLVINSKYGPIKVLLEKKLSSSFVLSDLVGHENYCNNKYLIKEALKQFIIFMCDFGLSSGFRYKLRILPKRAPSPSCIALYCSYSISLVNNFKLFKETISLLNKDDFDFVFHVIEEKLEKRKVNQILNYWRLKQ